MKNNIAITGRRKNVMLCMVMLSIMAVHKVLKKKKAIMIYKRKSKMEDNMNPDSFRGMFDGGNFPNAQIVVVTGYDNFVSYESLPKKTHDEKPQKQGKEAIMEYVGRLRPVVKDLYLEKYDEIWEGILEITEVKALIYNKGKQQDTTFNRNLIAQIIHQVDMLYQPAANSAQKVLYLEPEKGVDHPVRQKLGELPEKTIKKAIEAYIQTNLG